MSHVPMTSGATHIYCPPALCLPGQERPGEPTPLIPHPTIRFYLRIPTWQDRDVIGFRMYQLGVREVTAEQVQSLMIAELFEIYEEDKADEEARFLEGFWHRAQEHQTQLADWSEQESLRRLDALDTGIDFEAAPMPQETTTPRERARANVLITDLTNGSERLRLKLIDQQLYQKRFQLVTARLQIAGWEGLETKARFDPSPTMDCPVLSNNTIEGLRTELMKLDETGAAWEQICNEANGLFDLARSAEKNSSSPLENISAAAGSTTKNTAPASNDGSSSSSVATVDTPASSSEPIPADTSPTTTEPSSEPSPASTIETTSSGPTAEPSSTSPSD